MRASRLAKLGWLLLLVAGMAVHGQEEPARTHVVEKGETLYSVSRRYGIRVPDLTRANPQLRNRGLKAGETLVIPDPRGPQSAPPPPASPAENVQENPPPPQPAPSSVSPPATAEGLPEKHVLRKGETMSSVARLHKVRLADLQAVNPDVDPRKLRVGQSLHLPGSRPPLETSRPAPAARTSSPVPARPPAVARPEPEEDRGTPQAQGRAEEAPTLYLSKVKSRLDRIRVDQRRWKYIVIHHSATTEGNARYFDYYHRKVKKWENGLAYHFVIGNGVDSGNGEIEIGPRWVRQIHGGHVKGDYLNDVSIGICLVGNFDQKRPSRAQAIATIELIRYLNSRTGRPYPRVMMHREINPGRTACPGKLFPIRELRALLEKAPL